jgi:hypothetical protein
MVRVVQAMGMRRESSKTEEEMERSPEQEYLSV